MTHSFVTGTSLVDSVSKGCCQAGAFFEDMCSKKFIIPDIPIYRIFLDAYANGSRFDDAERMANLTVDANLKCIAKFCPLD
ncbi:hypothetical protein Bca52824_042594 [Brassica carinata]|uniref:Pentatricopeptide repeat-containing protein n=1 Tax=Brassica carinata TaxID=52824 RepID=A0A8X7RYM3_BRACI|nr:hypothetical protein Bca52824_042592 [Brassica carinata]KAG2295925.1 hypothetical protein Bca52824_042594 [Brassica carinata]